MDAHLNPEEFRAAVQDAIDAAASSYSADASLDVEERVREELQSRGLDVDDDAWVTELARNIRSGHPVVVGEDAPPVEG